MNKLLILVLLSLVTVQVKSAAYQIQKIKGWEHFDTQPSAFDTLHANRELYNAYNILYIRLHPMVDVYFGYCFSDQQECTEEQLKQSYVAEKHDDDDLQFWTYLPIEVDHNKRYLNIYVVNEFPLPKGVFIQLAYLNEYTWNPEQPEIYKGWTINMDPEAPRTDMFFLPTEKLSKGSDGMYMYIYTTTDTQVSYCYSDTTLCKTFLNSFTLECWDEHEEEETEYASAYYGIVPDLKKKYIVINTTNIDKYGKRKDPTVRISFELIYLKTIEAVDKWIEMPIPSSEYYYRMRLIIPTSYLNNNNTKKWEFRIHPSVRTYVEYCFSNTQECTPSSDPETRKSVQEIKGDDYEKNYESLSVDLEKSTGANNLIFYLGFYDRPGKIYYNMTINKGLSGGAIAGIIIAVIVVLAFIIYVCYKKRVCS